MRTRVAAGGRDLQRRRTSSSPPAAGRWCRRSPAPSSASPPTASSSCRARPQRVAIVGSGYIAVELAGVFCAAWARTPPWCCAASALLRHFEPMLGEAAARERCATTASRSSRRRAPAAPGARRAGRADAATLADGRRLGPFDALMWAIGRVPAIDGPRRCRTAGVALDAARLHAAPMPTRPPACRASTPSATSPAACS